MDAGFQERNDWRTTARHVAPLPADHPRENAEQPSHSPDSRCAAAVFGPCWSTVTNRRRTIAHGHPGGMDLLRRLMCL
ncbi:hypothetical protein SAMN04489713_110128 [Actinomadura madurae]|uniref:Uncharacterized protein n=1 Tax=Actinomadura madurae TaxID=1993 RepID=A0A1I5KT77_9ACTN|nr:hypothetical protein SAMN04489713_110128 [Actinomadura madurae]